MCLLFLVTLGLSVVAQHQGLREGGAHASGIAHQHIQDALHKITNENPKSSASITDPENKLIDALTRIGDVFSGLPQGHSNEKSDFGVSIRAAQTILLARVGLRSAVLYDSKSSSKFQPTPTPKDLP